MAASPVHLDQVLRALAQKKIPFVLTGAHAIGGWTGRPRATHDVDILVKGERVDALATIMHRDQAERRGRGLCKRLKEEISKHQFEIPIQAAIGTRIIAPTLMIGISPRRTAA